MRRSLFTLIAVLLMISPAAAQENKPQDQKPTASTATDGTEKPKNEVERMLEESRNSGETVLIGASEMLSLPIDGTFFLTVP